MIEYYAGSIQYDILESILYILSIGLIGVPEDLYLKRFN